MVQHLGQEPRDVCAATETEEINVISGLVVSHEEPVSRHDVFVNRNAQGGVLRLLVPRRQPLEEVSRGRQKKGGHEPR